MDAQLQYSKLLHASNYGIALRKPSYDISVGDLCYWDQEGKATRILNIFDNYQVCHFLLEKRYKARTLRTCTNNDVLVAETTPMARIEHQERRCYR